MGKTFSRDGKTVENGQLNLTNLRAENIRRGVVIDGVRGGFRAEPDYYHEVNPVTSGYSQYQHDFVRLRLDFNHYYPTYYFKLNLSGSIKFIFDRGLYDGTEIIVYKNGSQIWKGQVDKIRYVEGAVTTCSPSDQFKIYFKYKVDFCYIEFKPRQSFVSEFRCEGHSS